MLQPWRDANTMSGQTCAPNESLSLTPQEKTDETASSPSLHVVTERGTRCVWFIRGGAIAALMLVGVLEGGLLPNAWHQKLPSEVALAPSAIRTAVALPAVQRQQRQPLFSLRLGALPAIQHQQRQSRSPLRHGALIHVATQRQQRQPRSSLRLGAAVDPVRAEDGSPDHPLLETVYDIYGLDAQQLETLDDPTLTMQPARPVDISARHMIILWMYFAERADDYSRLAQVPPAKQMNVEKVEWRKKVLDMMANELRVDEYSCGAPDEILALVPKAVKSAADEPFDISVLGTICKHSRVDKNGKLETIAKKQGLDEAVDYKRQHGRIPVVRLDYVVSSPMPVTLNGGAGKEFLLQLVRRAAAVGRMVVLKAACSKLHDYYQEIGFEDIDPEGNDPAMVFSQTLPKGTDNEVSHELGRLPV